MNEWREREKSAFKREKERIKLELDNAEESKSRKTRIPRLLHSLVWEIVCIKACIEIIRQIRSSAERKERAREREKNVIQVQHYLFIPFKHILVSFSLSLSLSLLPAVLALADLSEGI